MKRPVIGVAAGVVALGLMASASVIAPQDHVLLAGASVIRASTVALIPWGIGVVLVTLAVAAAVLRRNRPRAPVLPVVGVLVLIAGLAVSGAWTLGIFVWNSSMGLLNDEQYVVVRPPASTACALILSERDFIARSDGEIYLVNDLGIGEPMSWWSGDDVQRPFLTPGSTVAWRPAGGTMRLEGSGSWVEPSRIDFTCPN